MAWTNPTTVSTGDVLTASRYNADVVANWNQWASAWSDFIPTMSGGWLLGNSTYTAKYIKIGRFVQFYTRIVVGSSATKGTTLYVALPATAASAYVAVSLNAFARLASGGIYPLPVGDVDTSKVELLASVANQTYTVLTGVQGGAGNVPNSWATGDTVYLGGTYEAAS